MNFYTPLYNEKLRMYFLFWSCAFSLFFFLLVTLSAVSFYGLANTVHIKQTVSRCAHTHTHDWIYPFLNTFLLGILKYCHVQTLQVLWKESNVLWEHGHACGEGFFHFEIIHLFVLSCSFVISKDKPSQYWNVSHLSTRVIYC